MDRARASSKLTLSGLSGTRIDCRDVRSSGVRDGTDVHVDVQYTGVG